MDILSEGKTDNAPWTETPSVGASSVGVAPDMGGFRTAWTAPLCLSAANAARRSARSRRSRAIADSSKDGRDGLEMLGGKAWIVARSCGTVEP